MRFSPTVYPVDRYLVESSNKMEMVNVTDDEIWNTAPAIRPEDEVMLSKLNEMLQATADDLKLISGELMQYRQPRLRARAPPAPLDDEFNEKVHIEEIVDAKFQRCNILDESLSRKSQRGAKTKNSNLYIKPIPKTVNASVQVNRLPNSSKDFNKKNLAISHTKIVQIDEHFKDNVNDVKVNNVKRGLCGPFVSYNEFSHTYEEPNTKQRNQKPLRVQEMPSINIRSELKEQKVLQLDIIPEQNVRAEDVRTPSNVAVIAVQHEPAPRLDKKLSFNYPHVVHESTYPTKPPVRRVSKMLPCETSESSNNVSSDAQDRVVTRHVTKPARSPSRPIATNLLSRNNINTKNKTATETRNHRNVDEWKRKLNTIYGITSTSRNRKTSSNPKLKKSPTKSSTIQRNQKNSETGNILNNAEYIPYTKLTLGGMRVSDVEREISDIPDKNVPLGPILDKILTSRENSFHSNPKSKEGNRNVLTASDEDLLEEVLDIEKNVSEALAKNLKEKISPSKSNTSTETGGSDKQTYAEDFEEEKTEHENSLSDDHLKNSPGDGDSINDNIQTHGQNTLYKKTPSNLSFKDSVDIFEFVHSIDTQDHATQSNPVYKISLKATQTSPRNVQPIRNDLWPSENSKDETNKILNKELIKNLIVDECSDILKKILPQASTSKDKEDKRNFTASQKNTQTSPARVRSVMTSPTKTKTRTTSPAAPPPAVHRQTSPLATVTAEELHIEMDEIDDLAVSINLSSPRFSLRLPRTSRDVLSNLDVTPPKYESKPNNITSALKTFKKCSSSSSADGDYSSSDISSLGEIEINKFKRRPRKTKNPLVSESSGSSISRYSADVSGVILPLRSEGEVSVGNADIRKSRFSRSEGEVSLGQTLH